MSLSAPIGPHSPVKLLEPGDRFEVSRTGAGQRISLPRVLGPDGFPFDRLEDQDGQLLKINLDPAERALNVPELSRLLPASDSTSTLWLEYRSPGTFRLAVEAEPGASQAAKVADVVTEQGIPIALDPRDWSVIRDASGWTAGLREFDLALRAAR